VRKFQRKAVHETLIAFLLGIAICAAAWILPRSSMVSASALSQGDHPSSIQIMFRFQNAELKDALPEFGRLLGLNVPRVDPGVTGTLSLESSRPMPREEAFQTFLDILKNNNAVLIRRSGSDFPTIYGVIPASQVSPQDNAVVKELPPANPTPNASTIPGVKGPQREPVRVTANLMESKLINHVEPVFPEPASRASISGMVSLEVLVNEKGEVASVRIYSGHPLLQPAAREAVMQWQYAPTYVGGEAVPVLTTVYVTFVLKKAPGPH